MIGGVVDDQGLPALEDRLDLRVAGQIDLQVPEGLVVARRHHHPAPGRGVDQDQGAPGDGDGLGQPVDQVEEDRAHVEGGGEAPGEVEEALEVGGLVGELGVHRGHAEQVLHPNHDLVGQERGAHEVVDPGVGGVGEDPVVLGGEQGEDGDVGGRGPGPERPAEVEGPALEAEVEDHQLRPGLGLEEALRPGDVRGRPQGIPLRHEHRLELLSPGGAAGEKQDPLGRGVTQRAGAYHAPRRAWAAATAAWYTFLTGTEAAAARARQSACSGATVSTSPARRPTFTRTSP